MTTMIFATVVAKPEFTHDVESALKKMIPATRAEAGCVSYALYASEEKVGTFLLLETYADAAALASHQQSPHFGELVASLTGKLASDIQIERIAARAA